MAHIGAIKAMEDLGFTFAGVAGASAGAFIAALTAVGYGSEDIFSKASSDRNLLARHARTPLSLLGRWRWTAFTLIRHPRKTSTALVAGGSLLTVELWVAGASMFRASMSALACSVAVIAIVMLAVIVPAWRRRGWFDSRHLHDFVNEVMKAKLKQIYSQFGSEGERFDEDRVPFRHLDEAKFPGVICPLKIIATDIDEARLVLFDSFNTPDVEVGAAVAASIAIPFVFPAVFRSLCKRKGEKQAGRWRHGQ